MGKAAQPIAAFASVGPESCSGMPVARYSSVDLAETLGPDFVVIENQTEEHVTPGWGWRSRSRGWLQEPLGDAKITG